MQQCLLEPGHCRFTGIHKVGTLLLSVRKCGSWEGCKKSKFAQIYRPLAIIDQGKIWALSACGKSEGLLNFQVLLVRKVPMENCPMFSKKKKGQWGGHVWNGLPFVDISSGWLSFSTNFLSFISGLEQRRKFFRGYGVSLSKVLIRGNFTRYSVRNGEMGRVI